MIRPGFLDSESRQDLIELTRDGSAAHRLARRANALVLLDDGMSCEAVAKVTLRSRHSSTGPPTGSHSGPGHVAAIFACPTGLMSPALVGPGVSILASPDRPHGG